MRNFFFGLLLILFKGFVRITTDVKSMEFKLEVSIRKYAHELSYGIRATR